jgi:hypothetical protein
VSNKYQSIWPRITRGFIHYDRAGALQSAGAYRDRVKNGDKRRE